jgi:RNA polymerase-binding transcription factor DksA
MNLNGAGPQIEKLKAEQAQILVKLAHLQEALRSEVDPEISEGDPELIEHETALALTQALEHRLTSIDHALRQAQNGVYGICELCKEPIDPARLAAVPETTLCLKCKLISERQARLRALPVHA